MVIRELRNDEIIATYNDHLYHDFPSEERKPLDRIMVALNDGTYKCIGAFNDNCKQVAYAFFVVIGNKCLLDYFAVFKELRGKGTGSEFLQKVLREIGYESVIIEIEDPEKTNDENERKIRSRRMDFYLRCGCKNTGVKASAFGVEFLLLEYPESHDKKEVASNYLEIYKAILPKKMFENNMFIL